jgi:hypothetical protein
MDYVRSHRVSYRLYPFAHTTYGTLCEWEESVSDLHIFHMALCANGKSPYGLFPFTQSVIWNSLHHSVRMERFHIKSVQSPNKI